MKCSAIYWNGTHSLAEFVAFQLLKTKVHAHDQALNEFWSKKNQCKYGSKILKVKVHQIQEQITGHLLNRVPLKLKC